MRGNMSPFYDHWFFQKTGLDVELEGLKDLQESFAPVELPHDWLIYQTNDLYENGCGWYRKEFELVKETGKTTGETEVVAADINGGERVIVRFDGVYMNSTVYVNGQKLKDWKYGYSTFDVDITEALKPGKNQMIVQVRHQSPNSRWYSGAGIYRKVWMKVCPAVYLPLDGTYVTIQKNNECFSLEAETEVAGKCGENMGCCYRLWKDGKVVQELGWSAAKPCEEKVTAENAAQWETVLPNCKAGIAAEIHQPLLWDIEAPNLYHLTVELCEKDSNQVIDVQDITIGFRQIEMTTDKGLFLNGRHVKLHGVCEHHDLGCLGAAFNKAAMRRKMKMLKSMGVNAIRTSHNMPAPELMELADEMGFLVDSEGFDMWERCKTEYDYGCYFKDWVERDVRSWVRRDRNHPSLMMWSIGNEIYDTHADEHGQDITRRLMAAVQAHDPKQNGRVTIGSNYMAWENARKCADIVKIAGYNYGEACYEAQHREHPDWMMYGSETASVVQSRGIYHFPLCQGILCEDDEQCSSLGNSATSWGAKSWEKCIADDRDPEYIMGMFIWTGFDYIGEPTPYHTKNSYFGQIDTAGFPKDSYYVYRAEWTDGEKFPFVHLFPYWDFNEGQQIDLRACTNASEVELFVNGVSQGRQHIDHERGLKLLGEWQVAYTPGIITAVAYDENGAEVARDSHSSFGDSRQIVLTADKQEMAADCEDLCFVEISVKDAEGNPVENASDYVLAEVSGPVRILGMDNGDSTDYDSYKTNVRKLFSGKLLVVLGNYGESGEAVLKVSGKGLETAKLPITVKAAGNKAVIKQHYMESCCELAEGVLPDRIPARKLELKTFDGQTFSPEKKEIQVEAVLYPSNTTDRELIWKAVTPGGIEVNFIKIDEVESSAGKHVARVTAIGDGEFYVRCSAKCGDKTVLISQLEFTAQGLGKACLNPYEFVSAGLFTDSVGEIGNGNEKGIATDRCGESGVVFSNVDFGEYGSDELTISIFALNDESYPVDIWLGKPHEEGSRLLETVIYQKPSKWNVYQEETYQLPERIKGVATIAFVLREKVHIKGFVFTKQNKAYGRLYGGEASAIYGDTFTRDGNVVRGIGNNVTISYENMDFGAEGATSVTLSGYTPLAVNTIHISFTAEDGSTQRRIIEFKGNEKDGFNEQTFAIEKLYGKGRVELVFLPGCRFDLETIQFRAVSDLSDEK